MSCKRACSDDSSILASLKNVLTGETFPIKNATEIIIGRSLESTIVINEVFISRRHCSIQHMNNGFFILDLGSSAGTYVNFKRIYGNVTNSTKLYHGNLIGFGRTNSVVVFYEFILHTSPQKKTRYENRFDDVVCNRNENHKNSLSGCQAEIFALKSMLREFNEQFKKESKDVENMLKNIMDISLDNSFKKKEDLKQMKNQITTLKTMYSKEKVASGELTKQYFAQLKNEFQCCICLDLICRCTIIQCGHIFCNVCIRTWRNNNNSNCPICRAYIVRDSKCIAIDNFITKTCIFMGGEIQKQRELALNEKSVSIPNGRVVGRDQGNNSWRPTAPVRINIG